MRKINNKGKGKIDLKYFNTIEVAIIMIITSLFSIFIGSIVTFKTIQKKKQTINCQETKKDMYIETFKESYKDILENYYDSIDKDKLIDSAIEGMITYLDDPYAKFFNNEETISFLEEVEGEYKGIGCEISKNEKEEFYVKKILPNTPAAVSSLKENDIILEINNIPTIEKHLSDIKKIIKEGENKKIKLKVKSENNVKNIEIDKESIEMQSVKSNIKEKNNKKIGIISISVFASNTTKQFKTELKKVETAKIDSLIIDLRDNAGGYLKGATEIASMFLPKNKIIYQLNSKGIKEPILDETKEKRNYPIVVLINETSASASEVLTMALKDSYKATIIGIKSYGKGTIQKAYNLKDGSMYKYTIQKWLSPKGISIDKIGISPDIEIKGEENQLNKAIEILENS